MLAQKRAFSLTQCLHCSTKERDFRQELEATSHATAWQDKYVYALTAGCLGGLSVLFGGVSSKAILPILEGNTDMFKDPFTYASLGGMVVCIVLQTDLLNKAMMMGETMSVFPVFEASWITFGVGSGIMFYNPDVSWGRDCWEALGVLPMLVGVVFMMQHVEKQKLHVRRASMDRSTPSMPPREIPGFNYQPSPEASPLGAAVAGGAHHFRSLDSVGNPSGSLDDPLMSVAEDEPLAPSGHDRGRGGGATATQ